MAYCSSCSKLQASLPQTHCAKCVAEAEYARLLRIAVKNYLEGRLEKDWDSDSDGVGRTNSDGSTTSQQSAVTVELNQPLKVGRIADVCADSNFNAVESSQHSQVPPLTVGIVEKPHQTSAAGTGDQHTAVAVADANCGKANKKPEKRIKRSPQVVNDSHTANSNQDNTVSPVFAKNTRQRKVLPDGFTRRQGGDEMHIPGGSNTVVVGHGVEFATASKPVKGPWYCKLLLPNHTVGAIIGRDGHHIRQMTARSGSEVQVSAPEEHFPGTLDRVCIIGGTMDAVECAVAFFLQGLKDSSVPQGRLLLAKLVVPNSAVSCLIGHGGASIRSLADIAKCRINISPRVPLMKERVVFITGDFVPVLKASIQVVRIIQTDPNVEGHRQVHYSVNVPLGAWSGTKALPVEPECPLINPEHATAYNKRALIEFLLRAAPREILLRYGLLGKIANSMKAKSHQDLTAALEETWSYRHMNGTVVAIAEMPAEIHPSRVEDPSESQSDLTK